MTHIISTPTQAALDAIDLLAKDYTTVREVLAERVASLESELHQVRNRRLPGIRSALAIAKTAQDDLQRVIAAAPSLFIKPRTFTLHGVKVGFQKGKGKLTWADDARVIALIEKHLPDKAEILIVTERKPSRDALANLDGADLKRIGVTIEEVGDKIVIKAADSDLDKVIAKILEEGAKETEAP